MHKNSWFIRSIITFPLFEIQIEHATDPLSTITRKNKYTIRHTIKYIQTEVSNWKQDLRLKLRKKKLLCTLQQLSIPRATEDPANF